jgi:hypothetical protein
MLTRVVLEIVRANEEAIAELGGKIQRDLERIKELQRNLIAFVEETVSDYQQLRRLVETNNRLHFEAASRESAQS